MTSSAVVRIKLLRDVKYDIRGDAMEVNVLEQKRRVEIWLTNDDSNNAEILEAVEQIKKEYRARRFFTVVFHSGAGDLLANTELLLSHNKTG